MVAGYGPLTEVYEWLIPDRMLSPADSVGAFRDLVESLPRGARVLDCACGTGQLAVGLAGRGLEVVASDASPGMIRRTRELADEHGVRLRALACRWDELPERLVPSSFDLVLCVGNSLAHAEGASGRVAALAAMARLLAPDGRLAVMSRTWELVRAGGSRVEVRDRLIRRSGRDGVVVYSWQLAEAWQQRHHLEIAVAFIEPDGSIRTCSERLSFWPFRYHDLVAELQDIGLDIDASTFDPAADQYRVVARRL